MDFFISNMNLKKHLCIKSHYFLSYLHFYKNAFEKSGSKLDIQNPIGFPNTCSTWGKWSAPKFKNTIYNVKNGFL